MFSKIRTCLVASLFAAVLSSSANAKEEVVRSWTFYPRLPSFVLSKDANRIDIQGALKSSHDGAVFSISSEEPFFDLRAGGLKLDRLDKDTLVLSVTGEEGEGCKALHVSTPCLVPRIRELAHARLLSEEKFLETLSGSMTIREYHIRFVPKAPSETESMAPWLIGAGSATLLLLFAIVLHRRRQVPIVQVERAAKQARLAVQDDPVLSALVEEIDRLVALARKLEAQRKRHAESIQSMQSKSATLPEQERKEFERLLREHKEAVEQLLETASALRVLRVRAKSGAPSTAQLREGLEHIKGELVLRDKVLSEMERIS